MNIWRILEIEETIDKDAIQAAYRAKLLRTHPEDDPEGFMELRAAYEEAVKLADKAQKSRRSAGRAGNSGRTGAGGGAEFEQESAGGIDFEQEDGCQWGTDPVGQWMRKVDDVYRHFSKRKDPLQWQQLLEDDAAINLDTKIQARSELLKYFMEHYFISREVMTLLDQHFGFMETWTS